MHFDGFQMLPDPVPTRKVVLKVKVYDVVTRYDPVHLLQRRCQHVAGVGHHLESDNRRRRLSEGKKKKK